MKKQMKLRKTILITTILITTTIVLMLGFICSRQFEDLLTERMVSDYQETANTMQKNVETLILYAQDFTKYMALNENVIDVITEYQNMTEESRALNQVTMKLKWDEISNRLIYSTTMIYNLDFYSGIELIYSYYDDPMESDTKNIPEEVLRTAASQASPLWTELLTLKQFRSYAKNPEYGFAVVKSVQNKSAKKLGVIAVYVRESSFADILKLTSQAQESKYYLVGKDDTVFSSVDKEKLYEKAHAALGLSEEEYQRCLEDGILLKKRDGTPLLYVSRNVGENGLKLVGETTMEELGKQQRDLKFFVAGMVLLSVVLAFVSAWFVSKQVTKPLGKLMGIMEQIKKDDRGSHLRYPEGTGGEIGILGSQFNELMDRLDESKEQIYQEQRQRRHNEVRLLQAQIVPHFLYNTMGIISSFIKLGMSKEALDTIQNLVSFYRISLSSGKEVITLKEEVELTNNYMSLQRLRYIEYMDYDITCEESVEECRIPKLTIQPLVENVLHHGLKQNGDKCRIRVHIIREGEKAIRISVEDNGTGITRERLTQLRQSLKTGVSVTHSFGILNIHQRLRLMYGDAYRMEINSVEGAYTEFALYLPWQKEEKVDV